MHSLCRKPKRRLRRKEKGKKIILEYDSNKEKSEQSKSDSESAKRALKSIEQKLCRSAHQKNPMMQFGYNEYLTHHYVYMTRVV